MIVSHEHRFIFIAQPKTASVAVEAALRPYGRAFPLPKNPERKPVWSDLKQEKRYRYLGIHKILHVYGADMVFSYLTIAVKRDPVDRFLSFFFFRQRDKIADESSRFFRNYTGKLTLDDYINAIDAGDMDKPKPQLDRITLGSARRVVVNRLLRFEHLEADLAETCAEIGIPFDGLPRRNTSVHRKGFGIDDLTEEQHLRIASMYADDIAALGYAERHAAVLPTGASPGLSGLPGRSTASASPSSGWRVG